MKIHFIHGFNVRDNGRATVGRLAEFMEARGHTVIVHKFGWRGLFGVRFFNVRRVAMLAARVESGDVAIGHSDGCNLINQAAHFGAPFSRVVYVNPALNADTPLADQVEAALVFADRGDPWVRLSRWLPLHPWGQMGARGPTVDLERYVTIYHQYGHGGIFKTEERVKKLGKDVLWFLKIDLSHVRRPFHL